MDAERVIKRIKELLSFNSWSLYKLAKESSLPYSSLSNLMNRGNCPSIPTLQKICDGFGISISEFFDFETNPLRNNELTEDEQIFLNKYRRMTSYQKKSLDAFIAATKNMQ